MISVWQMHGIIPTPDVCTREFPKVKCASRRDAERAGEIFYSFHHRGFIYPAEHRAVPRVLRERHEQPFTWTHCPFCNGELPDLISSIGGALKEPWRDPPVERPKDTSEGGE